MRYINRSIVSIEDLDKEEIIRILETADKIQNAGISLKGKIMAALFFEPSTRTRLSFESAMLRLGGQVIGFADSVTTSCIKGESLSDTIRMVESYADVIVMRHFMNRAASEAAEISKIPIINAGDGSNEHPTQALIDLYTIKKLQGNISCIKIALAGDLLYGRCIHSLALALSYFGCELSLISPKQLMMPKEIKAKLELRNIKFKETENLKDEIPSLDIIYMPRIQKERFKNNSEYEKLKGVYILDKKSLAKAKPNLKVLSPLPRLDEISKDLDGTKFAGYFDQASNAVKVRQAILAFALGKLD